GSAVRNLLPLKTGLQGIAAQFGAAASEGLKFVQSQRALGNLRTILQGTQDAVGGLVGGIGPLIKAFTDVGAAVAKAFGAELGSGIDGLLNKFGGFLTRIAESGQAVQWVNQALTVFAQLGDVIGNVGSVISGMFRAAQTAGGGFLANLQQVTKSFAEFVNSARGQEALGNVFGTIATIAAQLGPILSALVTQIGAIAPALAPVFTALGPAIVGLVNALGPALAAIAPSLQTVATALAGAFAAIGPALGPVGAAIGAVVEALAPLLPLVGQVVASLAQMLAPVLQSLAALFAPIITALSDALMPILPVIAQAFTQLVQAMMPLATGVGQAIAQLI
ncbi:hypothetical protein ACFY49_38500, partial [Streptomyces misionensis]